MNTREFMEVLQETIILDMAEKGSRITGVSTLEEAGLMGKDVGLVIRTNDGSTFRLVIDKINK